jgi:hypothetical protein
MNKLNRFIRILSAVLIIFTLIAALAPSSALAKGKVVKRKKPGFTPVTQTIANSEALTEITLIAPSNQETCKPSDTIQTTGVPGDAKVVYTFWLIEGSNQMTKLGSGQVVGNLNKPFPYPATIEGTMTFGVTITVVDTTGAIIKKDAVKWTVTCGEVPPTETETPPPPTETETPPPPTETETPPPPTETETPPPPTETETPPPPTETETPPPPTETPPPTGGEGCTPGYWRQEQHFDSWVGYYPSNDFGFVFDVSPTFDPHSLLDAVWLGGAGESALARHAVAALLNASNPGVNYAYSVSQVIAMVQFAYESGAFEATKDLFAEQNEAGCPLN